MSVKFLILFLACATVIVFTVSGCTNEEQTRFANRTIASLEKTLAREGALGVTPEQWTKKIEQEPKEPRNYLSRGNSFSVRNQTRLAIQDFDTAIRLDPKLAVAYFFRGESYRMMGNYEYAVKDLTEALAKIPKYQPETLHQIDQVYVARGSCYLSLQKYNLALADLDEAIKRKSTNASAYVLRSCVHFECGQANLALVDAEKAASLERNAMTLDHLGRLLRLAKRYDRALTVLNEPLKLSAETVDFFREKATLFRDVKRYKEGIAIANDCLELAPNDVSLYLVRGQCYSRSGDYQKAIRDFGMAVSAAASDSPFLSLVYSERASAYEVLGELDKAEDDIESVLKQPAGTFEPTNMKRKLIELLSAQRNPEKLAEAMAICTELIDQNHSAFDYNRRSMLYEHQKNYTAALDDLKKACELDQSYVGKYVELKARAAGAVPQTSNN